jgi:hypothetical protein
LLTSVKKRSTEQTEPTLPVPSFLVLFLLGVLGALRDLTEGMIVLPSFMSKSGQIRTTGCKKEQ